MGISYTFKMQAEHIKNMYGCVVDHKLLYLYMYTNARMLAAKACLHVAIVLNSYLHNVRLHGTP